MGSLQVDDDTILIMEDDKQLGLGLDGDIYLGKKHIYRLH